MTRGYILKFLALLLGSASCISANCPSSGLSARGVSEQEKTLIVQVHNQLRDDLASGNLGFPQASNMQEMSWSDKLAAIAADHAEKCVYEHGEHVYTKVDGIIIGENIAYSVGTKEGWESVLNWFWNEISDFDKNTVEKYEFGSYTHFSQMAWWSTVGVGCGYVAFPRPEDGRQFNFYVCVYGSTAAHNMKDDAMYRIGAPCSSCGNQCSSAYPHLCSSGSIQETEETDSEGECRNTDKHKNNCAMWAELGECESNPTFMKTECCASCQAEQNDSLQGTNQSEGAEEGECHDKEEYKNDCGYWAEWGECGKNAEFMKTECCASCQAKQNGECHDKEEYKKDCGYWAEWGECGKNAEFMKTECCASCQAK